MTYPKTAIFLRAPFRPLQNPTQLLPPSLCHKLKTTMQLTLAPFALLCLGSDVRCITKASIVLARHKIILFEFMPNKLDGENY